MLKKIVLTLALALQFGAIANMTATTANAEIPLPQCYPCPDGVR
jgi:hypothetical protein